MKRLSLYLFSQFTERWTYLTRYSRCFVGYRQRNRLNWRLIGLAGQLSVEVKVVPESRRERTPPARSRPLYPQSRLNAPTRSWRAGACELHLDSRGTFDGTLTPPWGNRQKTHKIKTEKAVLSKIFGVSIYQNCYNQNCYIRWHLF